MTTALERAWAIARAHGHHWASGARPARLALGRALMTGEADLDVWDEACEDEHTDWIPVPPRSHQEAEWLSVLPTAIPGIGRRVPVPAEDGTYSDVTGTGRCRWWCRPDGTTVVEIWRPAGRVISCQVDQNGHIAMHVHGDYCVRHVYDLSRALDGLQCSLESRRLLPRLVLGASDTAYRPPMPRRGETRTEYFGRCDVAREEHISRCVDMGVIE